MYIDYDLCDSWKIFWKIILKALNIIGPMEKCQKNK